MHVAELWRYPVKSMAGERIETAELTPYGIAGDRGVLVARPDRLITARTHPRLLRHRATLGPDGEPLVDGKRWDSPEVAVWIETEGGAGAQLVRYDGPERFDVLPLLVATDGAIAALGEDGRRLRPNIVIDGVEGLAERGWEGKLMRINDATIYVRDLRKRCVMTTYHPDTLQQDLGVLKRIVNEFEGSFALNCSVVVPGTIRIGDEVAIFER